MKQFRKIDWADVAGNILAVAAVAAVTALASSGALTNAQEVVTSRVFVFSIIAVFAAVAVFMMTVFVLRFYASRKNALTQLKFSLIRAYKNALQDSDVNPNLDHARAAKK